MTGRLAGRVVLVTGASSGLGRGFARTLAGQGAAVIVAARRTDPLRALADELTAAGGQAGLVAMDVADEASVIAAYDQAEALFGPIDTVVANAGIAISGSSLDMPIADFDAMIGVNLKGVFLTAREGARRMVGAGSEAAAANGKGGRIVIVSSIGAHTILPGVSGYCASKAGAAMLGRAMARELARKGVNVNVLCPGYVETDLNSDWFASDGGRKQVAGFPRRRIMRQSDLDETLVLLCSDAARAITGSVITLDDGQSL